MSSISINGDSVLASLASGKFDIGGNPYGVMVSISSYVNSIYSAIESLEASWASAVADVGDYIEVFRGVKLPERDPSNESAFLDNSSGSGSLVNVNSFLNVRSSSGSDNKIVGTLAAGTAFSVLGSATDSSGNTWYKVQYKDANGNDVTGYADARYISVSENSQASDSYESYEPTYSSGSESSSTSPRSTPSPDSSPKPEPNRAPTRTPKDNLRTGSTDPSKDETTKKALTNGDVNVLGENGQIIGSLGEGQEITVINDDGKSNLVKIKLSNGQVAYVERSQISFATPTPSQSPNGNVGRVKLKYSNNRLNVRSSPSNGDDTNIVGTLSNNSSVEILEKGETWTKIKYDGAERYVSTEYIDL